MTYTRSNDMEVYEIYDSKGVYIGMAYNRVAYDKQVSEMTDEFDRKGWKWQRAVGGGWVVWSKGDVPVEITTGCKVILIRGDWIFKMWRDDLYKLEKEGFAV